MTQVTTYHCDFSSQVRQHDADYHLVSTTNGDKTGAAAVRVGDGKRDACHAHMLQMVKSLYLDPAVVEVTIRRFRDTSDKKSPDAGAGHLCECGNGVVYKTKGSLASHRRNAHRT